MRVPSLSLAVALLALPGAGHAYKLQGPSWDIDRGPIPYHLHPSGSDDVDGDADLEEVRAAFDLWSCVEGSGLRLVEADEPGEKVESLLDGKNNVFWDEDNTFALGPGTYSVTRTTAFVPDQPAVRDAADIILNGFDHTWTTGAVTAQDQLPIFNVLVREIGVMLGLGADCLVDDDPTSCPGPDDSVMSPYIPATPRAELTDDDVEAVLALYATDDGSTCRGPFRQGEACSCNDDCVGDMVCAPDTDGKDVCSPTCSSEDTSCPTGFSCVLAAREGESAPGQCVRIGSAGLSPVAATCQNDRDCAEGLCANIPAVGRTACRVSCDADNDCPAQYACSEGHCTWAGELGGLVCEDTIVPSGPCACQGTSSDAAGWWLAAWALFLGLALRRRASPRDAAGRTAPLR